MIERVKTIRLFPANWESKSQNNEFCAENSAVEMFQLGELSTNRYFPNHSVYRLILTLGTACLTQQFKKRGMLPCTHGWALGLCTVFSTSCDAAMKETKSPVYTVSAAHTCSKPWFPGSLHSMASVPQEHTNHDHNAVLWANLASYQPPLLSANGGGHLLTLPTLMSECPRHGRRPHQHPPHKVTKSNKEVQRLLQKHTACFCSDLVCCHCFLSTWCQSNHRKPHALGCWQSQLTLDGYTQMPVRASLGQMVFVAPVTFLALNCQPSCDIASCYMEVLAGPGCHCWQTRAGGCCWKRLLVCVCNVSSTQGTGWGVLSWPPSCPPLLNHTECLNHIFPKHSCT